MSSRILTPDVVDIDAFRRNPGGALAHAERGAVAVFDNNAPAFYAVTPARMAELLALEKQLAAPRSDVALEAQFFDEGNDVAQPVPVPMGKFAMYPGWQPTRTSSAWPRCGVFHWRNLSPAKSWPLSSPTGRRKEKFSTISSGSKSWRAAFR